MRRFARSVWASRLDSSIRPGLTTKRPRGADPQGRIGQASRNATHLIKVAVEAATVNCWREATQPCVSLKDAERVAFVTGLARQAALLGMEPRDYIADTVGRFMGAEDGGKLADDRRQHPAR